MYNIVFYEDKDGFSELNDELMKLAKKADSSKDARIQFKQITLYIELLKNQGTKMSPNITKHLEDEIWELRPGFNRVLYFYFENNTFVLLHMFRKKTQKTPKSEIEKAGVGTRDASVAAALTLIGSLAEQGYKINYQWGGIHTELGINSQYGTPVGTGSCDGSYAAQGYDPSVCRTNYKWYGFDCGGFVTWAIYNGMQGSNSPGGVTVSRSNIFSYSANNKISLNSNKAVCKIGGVLDSTGHIVLVVGHDDVNKQYIVAEATGSRINTGYGGVKLSYYPYGKEGYWCGNLDDIYGD